MHYQDERTHGCRISDAWTYRGLKTVVMENELLRISLIADKGADMFELVHKPSDTDFMWRTPWSVRNQALVGAVYRMGRRDIPRSLHRRLEHDCSHRWISPRTTWGPRLGSTTRRT